VSAYVTFFEYVPYFFQQNHVTAFETIPLQLSVLLPAPASADSSPMSLVDTSEPPASKPVRDFKCVYTHRQTVPTSEPTPTEPFQYRVLNPQHFPLILISPLPFAKVNDLALIILFQSSFHSDLALTVSSESIPKSCEKWYLHGSKP